jgi:hypothetical protein
MKRPTDFIESNVNLYKGQLLICDSYLYEIAMARCWEEVAGEGFGQIDYKYMVRSFCPEKTLLDIFGFKMSTVLRLGRVAKIVVFTKDGSPHSLQIPLAIQEAAENVGFPKDKISYFVLEKDKVHAVSDAAVRMARHLSEI